MRMLEGNRDSCECHCGTSVSISQSCANSLLLSAQALHYTLGVVYPTPFSITLYYPDARSVLMLTGELMLEHRPFKFKFVSILRGDVNARMNSRQTRPTTTTTTASRNLDSSHSTWPPNFSRPSCACLLRVAQRCYLESPPNRHHCPAPLAPLHESSRPTTKFSAASDKHSLRDERVHQP